MALDTQYTWQNKLWLSVQDYNDYQERNSILSNLHKVFGQSWNNTLSLATLRKINALTNETKLPFSYKITSNI